MNGEPSILRDLFARFLGGESREDVSKQLDSQWTKKKRPEDERRYNCIVCLDSGRVEVWHHELVYAVAMDGPEAANRTPWRISLCACYCNAGNGYGKRIPRFDREKHCQVVPITGASGIVCNPEAIARLVQWIEECRVRRRTKPAEIEDPLFQGSGM